MSHAYESAVDLGDGIGHVAASALRDGIEDALQGCVEPGEEATVSVDSDRRLTVVVRTESEMGDNEASLLREAIADVLQAAAEGGEVFTVGEFVLRDEASPAP